MPSSGGGSSRASITDLRVGRHEGYDRLTVEFDRAVPLFALAPNPRGPGSTVFTLDPRGIDVTVSGTYGWRLRLDHIDIPNRYPGGNDLEPRYPVLQEARVVEDFEGVTAVAIGIDGAACPTMFTLSGPPRLVIDFPHG